MKRPLNEKLIKERFEKRMDTRKRTDTEFINSLEIVRDSKKIKNIRYRQGEHNNDDPDKYGKEYERIFGRSGAKPGATGTYKWDEKSRKMVKVSDEIPYSFKGLITL